MKKKFKDLKEGEEFFIDEPQYYWYGKKEVLIKIPFMENYYRTTGYKRNAKLKHFEKYFFIDDEKIVETT